VKLLALITLEAYSFRATVGISKRPGTQDAKKKVVDSWKETGRNHLEAERIPIRHIYHTASYNMGNHVRMPVDQKEQKFKLRN
jgi:hypothetical protein